MRFLAFITDASTIRDILPHLGELTVPQRFAPARGASLWWYRRARISRARQGRTEFCSQCGAPHTPDDRFCAKWGARLKQSSGTQCEAAARSGGLDDIRARGPGRSFRSPGPEAGQL